MCYLQRYSVARLLQIELPVVIVTKLMESCSLRILYVAVFCGACSPYWSSVVMKHDMAARLW